VEKWLWKMLRTCRKAEQGLSEQLPAGRTSNVDFGDPRVWFPSRRQVVVGQFFHINFGILI